MCNNNEWIMYSKYCNIIVIMCNVCVYDNVKWQNIINVCNDNNNNSNNISNNNNNNNNINNNNNNMKSNNVLIIIICVYV
jgi:hypothetical protein